VPEPFAPLVQRPGLQRWLQFRRELALDDLAVADCGKIVLRRPGLGREFLAKQDLALLEGLEPGLPLPVELDADPVEMVEAPAYRQVLAPIVVAPVIFDELPGGEAPHFVGTGAERRVELRSVE